MTVANRSKKYTHSQNLWPNGPQRSVSAWSTVTFPAPRLARAAVSKRTRWKSGWASTSVQHLPLSRASGLRGLDRGQNEPGFQRKSIPSLSSLVDDLLSTLSSTSDEDRSFLPFSERGGDSVILLVNNLGGISELELSGVVKEAGAWLSNKGLKVVRAISGTFMTSLNMPGFSLSLVLLPSEKAKKGDLSISSDLLVELLDADTTAPGWKAASKASPNVGVVEAKKKEEKKEGAKASPAAAESEKGPQCSFDRRSTHWPEVDAPFCRGGLCTRLAGDQEGVPGARQG